MVSLGGGAVFYERETPVEVRSHAHLRAIKQADALGGSARHYCAYSGRGFCKEGGLPSSALLRPGCYFVYRLLINPQKIATRATQGLLQTTARVISNCIIGALRSTAYGKQ